ncbi:hypothetical protein ACTA71_003428 [Dictyostelium dimigraforme]
MGTILKTKSITNGGKNYLRNYLSITNPNVIETISKFPLNSNQHVTYPNQSAVTQQLWLKKAMEIKDQNNVISYESPKLITKTPESSRVEYILPFSTNNQLRENYLSPYGNLRIGRIIEDLDSISGLVATKHCENEIDTNYKTHFVSGFVSTINILKPLISNRDVKINGKVVWVGNSSMEIMIRVFSKDDKTQKWDPVLVSFFTMVGVDLKTMKPKNINPLKVDTPLDKKLFEDAQKRKFERLNQKSKNKKPITSIIFDTINSLLMISPNRNGKSPILFSNYFNYKFVPMKLTTHQSVIICHPQEKNINGKIFGGYLISVGFENAFSTCLLKFSKSKPEFKSLDGFKFLEKVEIGDILNIKSTITNLEIIENEFDNEFEKYYTQVEVLIHVIDPLTHHKKLACSFNFTFYCSLSKNNQKSGNKEIKRILPQNYSEVISYLKGKRIIDSHLEFEQSHSKLDVFEND